VHFVIINQGLVGNQAKNAPSKSRSPGGYNPAVANEFEFIEWIKSQQKANEIVRTGVGDDLAVLSWPGNDLLVVGVDQVLDGVHFDSSKHAPRAIGRKAMNRNLSDCAAMAALPAAALASVALPKGIGLDFAKELYLGIAEAAAEYECAIVGGETGSWDGKLAVTVTILGRSGGIEPIRRSGARAGDFIYITGALGGSILGRHTTFVPRVKLARELAQTIRPSAMIDLSDGLSRDLRHICAASNVGAMIEAAKIPIHTDVMKMPKSDWSPLEHALHDGEDYELLFTSSAAWPGHESIGRITADRQIVVDVNGTLEKLQPRAWEHSL
jgi:thiamine-monophosphate kinase